jgi:hypothetical protein
MQNKTSSIIEAIINTFIGLLLSITITTFYYWLNDIQISAQQNISLTIIMTTASILRGYWIRRYCNNYLEIVKHKIELIWIKVINLKF